MQVKIEVIEGTVHVVGPYSTENNDVWRSLGGKFTGGRWVMPDNETTRQKIAAMFGTKSEEVEVLVPNERLTDGEIVQIGGYVLAQRRGRDSRVEMPDGVSLAAGYFPSSGGSMKHPRVGIGEGNVFRLKCRRSFAEANGLELAVEKEPSIEI